MAQPRGIPHLVLVQDTRGPDVVLGALLVSTTGEHRPKLALYSGGRLWPQEAQASAPVAFLPR